MKEPLTKIERPIKKIIGGEGEDHVADKNLFCLKARF